MNESLGAEPDKAAIRAQLERILAAPAFTRSRRQGELLRYLVGESLDGRSDRIKAVAIAMDVFGRDATFDQQSDPIVRVEAGRLRQRLDEYYREAGASDPVVIQIPKGAYRPVFSISEPILHTYTHPAEVASVAEGSTGFTPGRVTLALAALVIVILLWPSQDTGEVQQVAPANIGQPFIMILPLENLSGEDRYGRVSLGLVEALTTALSKLSGLSVMAPPSILEVRTEGTSPHLPSMWKAYGVTHVVRGSIDADEQYVVANIQLLNARNREILWAERLSRPLDSPLALADALSLRIANKLSVQMQPEEQARLTEAHTDSYKAWVLYRQGMTTVMPPNDPARLLTARRLQQRARELDPDFAGSYAGESFSYTAKVLFRFSHTPADDLAQALTLAEQAISTDEEFGMGYTMRSFAQLMSGDLDAAMASVSTAIEIEPGTAFSHFVLGMNHVIAGNPQEGIAPLQEALRLDPVEPRTPYLNQLGIAQYAAGQYRDALDSLEYNIARGGPQRPHMELFIAASHAQLGQEKQARKIMAHYTSSYRDFPAQKWLNHWLSRNGKIDQTLSILYKLGLPNPHKPAA